MHSLARPRRPGGPAHPVAGGVAQHRGPHQQGAHHPERGVDGAVGDEQARGEQQGVARQDHLGLGLAQLGRQLRSHLRRFAGVDAHLKEAVPRAADE